jgi:periplasmic protein CpxP/Spy
MNTEQSVRARRGGCEDQLTSNTEHKMKLAKISLVAAIVLGGLVACSNLAVAQDAGTNAAKKGKRPTIEQQMERLDKELKLTDEQKPKVKAVMEEFGKKRQELFSDTSADRSAQREKMRTLTEEQNKKMKEILTADQFKKYEEMMKNMRGKKKGDAAPAAPSTTK